MLPFLNVLRKSTLAQICRRPLATLTHNNGNGADSLANAVSLIRSQPQHYILTRLHGQRYLLSPRDLLTLPRMRDVQVGDVIQLTGIQELGSREYTLRFSDELSVANAGLRVYARVVEHTKGAMEYIHKKKRRKGYERTIEHKQPYTRLRIGEFEFDDLD